MKSHSPHLAQRPNSASLRVSAVSGSDTAQSWAMASAARTSRRQAFRFPTYTPLSESIRRPSVAMFLSLTAATLRAGAKDSPSWFARRINRREARDSSSSAASSTDWRNFRARFTPMILMNDSTRRASTMSPCVVGSSLACFWAPMPQNHRLGHEHNMKIVALPSLALGAKPNNSENYQMTVGTSECGAAACDLFAAARWRPVDAPQAAGSHASRPLTSGRPLHAQSMGRAAPVRHLAIGGIVQCGI